MVEKELVEEIEKWWKEQGFIYDPPFEVKKKIWEKKVKGKVEIEGEPESIAEVLKKKKGEGVVVRGQVISVQSRGKSIWTEIVDDTGMIRVVLFRKDGIKEGQIIKVRGKVNVWKEVVEVTGYEYEIEGGSNEEKQESREDKEDKIQRELEHLKMLGAMKKVFVKQYLEGKGIKWEDVEKYFEEVGDDKVKVKI